MKYIMMATSSNFGNMMSMALAVVFIPFLPMLPVQILVNNFLYDLSEVAIPLDDVENLSLKNPTPWDIHFVKKFMWIFGSLSSVFDLITFFILIYFLNASEQLFRTFWFIESLATQVLVIFAIRTKGPFWQARPSSALIMTSLSALLVASLLPFLPQASVLGFVPLPLNLVPILITIVISYLALVEVTKIWFYKAHR